MNSSEDLARDVMWYAGAHDVVPRRGHVVENQLTPTGLALL
jgi:hypothetical protein